MPTVLSAMGKAGPIASVAAIGVAAFVAALGEARKAMSFADEIHDSAERLYVTTDALQEYRYAVEAVGGEQKDADKALEDFGDTLSKARQGVQSAVEPFRKLGFTREQIKSFTSVEGALDAVRGKFGELSEAQRAAVISQFGLKGMKDLLSQSVDEQDRLIQKTHEMGLVMDSELIKRGNKLNDEFETLQKAIDVQLKSALVDLGPILVGLMEWIRAGAGWAADIADNMRSIPDKTEAGLITSMDNHQYQINRIKGFEAARKGWHVDASGNVVDKDGRNRNDDLSAHTKRKLAHHEGKVRDNAVELLDRRDARQIGGGIPPPVIDTPGGGSRADSTAGLDRSSEAAAYSAQRDYYNALLAMTDDAKARAKIQSDLLTLEQGHADEAHAQAVADVMDRNSTNKVAQLADLETAKMYRDKAFAARQTAIDVEAEVAADKRLLDRARAIRNAELEVINARLALTTDRGERMALEIQAEDIRFQLAMDELKTAQDAEAARAFAADGTVIVASPKQAQALKAAHDARIKGIEEVNAGPLDKFFKQIENTNDAAESAAVDGLETFNKGLIDIATNGGKGIDVLRASLTRFLSAIANNSLMTLEKGAFDWLKSVFKVGGTSTSGGGGMPSLSMPGRIGTPPFLPAPHYAVGTDFHPGGLAMVGEMGPELVDLPRGARVFTAAETRNMTGAQAPVIHQTIHLNAQGAVLADTIIAEARAHAVQVGVAAVQGGDRMNRFNRAREGRRALL
ncbi:hypothetical protein [Asticcacaulis biprosthecium]|uniref:hypothetical protein n=1 Tax=Asticcacaulis biprosthecium TaxID=76891 RepID=UPI0012F4CFA2|nr:hypothetical protein [Asticcacaulis biprosthecium]